MKNSSTSSNLQNLRSEIDELDEQIASLLAKRQEIVKRAAMLKSNAGEGMVSKEREQNMLMHGAQLEADFGLPQSLMQDIQRRILRQSYKEKGSSYAKASSCQGQCNVVIVGGNGGMGSFFKRFLINADYNVSVVEKDDYEIDENNQKTSIENSVAVSRLKQAHWCIVSVPIDITVKVIEKIAPFLNSNCVLSDLTSVKLAPLEAMQRAHNGPILALHPMFGPDTFSFVKQVVVACLAKQEDRDRCKFILEQLKLFGARIVEVSAQEHDNAMRVIQALRHFTTISYGYFLKTLKDEGLLNNGSLQKDAKHEAIEQDEDKDSSNHEVNGVEQLLMLSSPIYRLELMMVGRLFAQDPALYCDIISASNQNFDLIHKYITCTNDCLKRLEKHEKEQFIEDFEQTRAFFGAFAKSSLQESAKILALVQDTYPIS